MVLLLVALAVADATPTPPTATVSVHAAPRPRRTRGELIVSLGIGPGGTDWRGDATGYGNLKLGFRLFRIATLFVQGRLGYGAVDQRMLTMLSIGIDLTAPIKQAGYLRGFAAWVHQHEEPGPSIANDPGGAFFGIGNGIRHRAGVQAGLGFDAIVWKRPNYEFTVGPEAMFAWLTYSSGPSWFGLVSLNAGGHFRMF
jgi:hypothetical protein